MYTFDELIDRRHTESTKWDRYQDKLQRDDLLPMWLADMDLPASDEIKEALMKRASHPITAIVIEADCTMKCSQNAFKNNMLMI